MAEDKKETDKQYQEEFFKKIISMLPSNVEVVKLEFEGPDIVMYIKNVKDVYENDYLIRNIATTIKKKIIIRSDPNSLLDPEKAREIIEKLIPADAGISNIRFIPEFSEVYIDAMKPGLVIGKEGNTLKAIILQTSWLPKVLRTPTIASNVIPSLRQMYFTESNFRKKFLLGVGKSINKVITKSEWLKATALGGFQEVGRSSLLLETPHSKIIIDCGLSPEPSVKGIDANSNSNENRAFPYLDSANISINDIDAVVLTHAHMDHIGFTPYLFKYGYEGPVYCTPPTKDLAALLLNDYIKLVQKNGGTLLYDEKDVRKMLMHTITREYNEVTNITNEIKLTYHNAGHILGSATIHLHIGEGMYNLVHTGDMKYGFTRLFDPTVTKYPRIDTLFIESTYGASNSNTPNRHDAETELINTIRNTIKNNGKVLIPLFAVGRSQEIMFVLESFFGNDINKLDAPIYLDGMILEASAIHTAYPEYLKENITNRILSNRSPFESEIFEVVKGEREQIYEKGPAVILASGGMMNGGASVDYFKNLSEDEKNTLIFVGYNSSNSLGRRLQNGLSEVALSDDDGHLMSLKVKMGIKTVEGFSGHSDRKQLLNFIQDLKPRPKDIFTMHGEEQSCENLARSINHIFHINSRAPMNLDSIRLK
ncbi:MAG: beta-CASP ribonuclease aCPSF1 [Candidatus Marsarchaeota archaeon]|nr:beta-CASP ribonuclease aCPSF1 [Candidatus Marsarchaeota archaeon]